MIISVQVSVYVDSIRFFIDLDIEPYNWKSKLYLYFQIFKENILSNDSITNVKVF